MHFEQGKNSLQEQTEHNLEYREEMLYRSQPS